MQQPAPPKLEEGFDKDGFPVTAGGQRLDSNNIQTQEKYLQERKLLNQYNRIKELHTELQDMKDAPGARRAPASNREKNQPGEGSVNIFGFKNVDPAGGSSRDGGSAKKHRRREDSKSPKGSRGRSRSKSPHSRRQGGDKQFKNAYGSNNDIADNETNYIGGSQRGSVNPMVSLWGQPDNEEDQRPPYVALIKESLMLTDSEVTISYMKFMIGVALFNFPAQAAYLGILNGFIATAVIVYFVGKSNENLVKAIPVDIMNQNLSYGQLVATILRNQSFKTVVDVLVLLCQGSNYILYMKYMGAQMNQIVCQETDGQFCAEDTRFFLYYYIPISVLVFSLAQIKNYKQVAYISKVAMIATVIAIAAIIFDSILQILVYMRVDYRTIQTEHIEKVEITYQQNDITNNINWMAPIFPHFMDCFCKIQVSFEGAPIVSKLYTSAQNKNFFVRNLNKAILAIGLTQAVLGILCVVAYGNHLQEIVLMNLNYGVFSNFIKLLFALGMVVNLVLQLVPMMEVFESWMPSIYGYGTSPNENKDETVKMYLYDPNYRTWCQTITRFAVSGLVVGTLLGLSLYFEGFHLLLLIDGALLTNVLVMMIPNALYLHQVNYGYLRPFEKGWNYYVGLFLFYFSLVNVIYVSFRALQQGMGDSGAMNIIN